MKVLVVDDDVPTCELLRELLGRQGYQVFTASDGMKAMEEFARVEPDVVVLDVQMPHRDGFQVCQELKVNAATRLVPVVLVTGLSAVEDRVRGIQAGADDFLSKPFDRNELLARIRSLSTLKAFTDELERAESVLCALARSIEAKDPYTEGHCERLSTHAVELAERMGLSSEYVTALRQAGIVHDLGKVAVPDCILLKPERLTSADHKIMQRHPIVGEQICSPLKSFQLVLPIIRHHHEKMDGSGYPDGLVGDEIPLTARILQIVDVYDALTTQRPYKPALPSDEALQVMKAEVFKGWWDPYVFAEFAQAPPPTDGLADQPAA